MLFPSGRHAISVTISSTFVSCFVSLPVASTTKTLSRSPSRFEMNAILRPSGDQRGGAVPRRVRNLTGHAAGGGRHVDVEVLVALEVRLDREPLSVRRELRLQDRLIGAQEGLLPLRPDVQDENGPLFALVRRIGEASSVGGHVEAVQLPDFLQEPLGRERDLATHETLSVGKVGGDKKPSRSRSSQEACCRTSRPFPSRSA